MNNTPLLRFQPALPVPIAITYFVVRDLVLPSGQMIRHSRLSRPIKRLGILRRVSKRIRRDCPAAFMVEVRQFR